MHVFAPDFHGSPLGLGARRLVDRRDGVRHYILEPDVSQTDERGALTEWRAYIESFATIDNVDVLDSFEDWSGAEPVAIVAFETIGVPAT